MRPALAVLCLFALACTAAAQHPITSFESEDDLKLLGLTSVRAERVQEHASDGEWALKVTFPGSETDTWPGISYRPDVDTTQFHALVFDVYNPSDEPVSLSSRIDPAEGTPIFGSRTIPPRVAHQAEIWVRGIGPITQVYPYIRMPRRDHTLFIDNIRWETLDLYFSPIHYEDDTPPPAPTEEESARGFILFDRPLTDLIFANTVPRPEERIETLGAFAAPGQSEPVTLALHALRDLPQVQVSFVGLPADGEVLPIRYRDKRVTYPSKEFIVGMPVLCERRGALDIAAGTSKRFLLDLRVDHDAPPGIHEGEVRIRSAGGPQVSLPFRLRVLPYRLQEPDDMLWGEYYTAPRLETTHEEKVEALKRDLADMRAFGMTSVGLCFGPPTENVEFTDDGECSLNMDGTSLYEAFMDLYVEHGFPAPVIQLADSGQGAASRGGIPFESDEWGERYKAYWRAMQQEHLARGWPEVVVQPVDEPGWQDRAAKDRNVRCLKLLKQIPGMRTEQDGPGDDYFHNEAGPYSDFWNYNGALAAPDVIAQAKADGRIILIYNCDVESYRPEVARYVTGWFQALSGASGSFNWAYISFSADPYDDQSHRMGTWMHVYPPLGDEPGGPSTGWIGTREGVDDYKYLHTLRRTIRRAEESDIERAQEAAREAREELEAILASLDYSPAVRNRARWTHTGTRPDGARTIGGTLKLPNGWAHDDYERARWRVAQATVKVLEALGEVEAAAPRNRNAGPPVPLLSHERWDSPAEPRVPAAVGGVERHVTIPVWTEGPTIDGALDDEVWDNAARLDPFVIMSGARAPAQQTDVLVGSDGTHLYVGAVCHEDNITHLTARVTQEGGRVWEDDCIEVFVDANLDRATYRQVLVNSLGVQGWNNSAEAGWRAASRAAAKVGEDAWTVELAIPLADLGVTGSEFGLNVARERRPMETLELSAWSPTGDLFGRPERFGMATLGQAWIGRLHVPAASIGVNEFEVTLKNESDTGRNVACGLWARWEHRTVARVLEQMVGLAPGEEKTLRVEYELPSTEPPVMTFVVLDQGTAATLAERSFTPVVLPPLAMSVQPRAYYLGEGKGRVELEVNLAGAMRDDALLTLAVYDVAADRVVRHAQVPPVAGSRFTAQLNLDGLPEAAYELAALLDTSDGERIAEAVAPLQRIRGPFD